MRTATSHMSLLQGMIGELVQVGEDFAVELTTANLCLGVPELDGSALEYARRRHTGAIRSWSAIARKPPGYDGNLHSSPVARAERERLFGVLGRRLDRRVNSREDHDSGGVLKVPSRGPKGSSPEV